MNQIQTQSLKWTWRLKTEARRAGDGVSYQLVSQFVALYNLWDKNSIVVANELKGCVRLLTIHLAFGVSAELHRPRLVYVRPGVPRTQDYDYFRTKQ